MNTLLHKSSQVLLFPGQLTPNANHTIIKPMIPDNSIKTEWGKIIGNIIDQTDLVDYLDDTVKEQINSINQVSWSILDSFNSREYIDLGLPSGTLWASCNVGAESPEEYGDYFAWGETTVKSNFVENNSVTYGLSIQELKSRGIIGSDDNLTAAYDAATANWGSEWRMPTLDEMKELINECEWEWATQNGVKGRRVTGSNGNSIFIPAAGWRRNSLLDGAGSYGSYWSATPFNTSYSAHNLSFNSDDYNWYYSNRYYGRAVRPVIKLNKPTITVVGEVLEVQNASYKNEILEIKGAKVDNETLIFNK